MKKIINKLIISLMLPALSGISGMAFANTGFSALVVEPKTNKVIYEHNANQRRYPASLTKIMTLYIMFEDLSRGKLKLNQQIKISPRAAHTECSCLRTKSGKRPATGSTITVDTAIKALIVQSANDVALSVAEHISGSEANFAKRMNQTAKRLGMRNTHFVNPHGLPNDNQYTTAQDMVTLAIATYEHFPKYYPLFKLNSFVYGGRTITGHNRVNQQLLGADGLKTGYIRKSGSNLVTSAQRGNTRLFAVVIGGLNSTSRDNIMVNIMNDSFDALNRNARNPSISPVITEDLLVGYNPKNRPKTITATNQKSKIQINTTSAPANIPTLQLVSSTSSNSNINPASPAAIQVGAYKNRKSAQDRARLAHRKLKQGKIDIVLINNIYRAQLSGFSYENATLACNQLKQSGSDCLVVKK